MERRFSCEIKGVSESGEIEGYVSVYGNKDLNGDIVEPGAFTKTIQENGGQVPLLYQHDWARPIGIAKVFDDRKGLRLNGVIETDIPDGALAYSLAKKGIVRGLSIGYRIVKQIPDSVAKAFRLKELNLLEGSMVTRPANPETLIDSVKSDHEFLEWVGMEIKAGRTLSASTRNRIEQSIKDLQALLAEADAAAADPQEPLKHSIGRLTAILRSN